MTYWLLSKALDLVENWPSKSTAEEQRPNAVTPKRVVDLECLHASSDAFAALAEFADAQFKTFDSYIQSPEFATRRRLLANADADAAYLNEVDRKR